jgi:hypothetical protein
MKIQYNNFLMKMKMNIQFNNYLMKMKIKIQLNRYLLSLKLKPGYLNQLPGFSSTQNITKLLHTRVSSTRSY